MYGRGGMHDHLLAGRGHLLYPYDTPLPASPSPSPPQQLLNTSTWVEVTNNLQSVGEAKIRFKSAFI